MRPSGWQETFEEANVSEEHFRTLVDTIPALVWSARPDGSAEFLNQGWLDYTGLSAEQALGWGWTAAIHPDDRDALIEYWRSILASGEPGEFEAQMRRFDGEYRWFLFRGIPLRDATGLIVKWCGTNADIDDRKRAEIDLRRILDCIPGLVATNTPSGETELVNRQMSQYFGRTLEELKGWRTLDAVHPEDLPFVVNTIEAWMRSPGATGPFELDLRLRRADGIYRWFHLRALPERKPDLSVVRWYHLLTDIEQRRQAEETIRASELDLRLTVNSIPALVNILTASGEIEFTNQPLLNYFGMTLEELRGRAGSDVIHPDDLPTAIAAWKHSVETGTPFDLQYRLRRADGLYRWFHGRILPLRDQDNRIIRWYSVLADIDDLKRAAEALRQTQSRLAQAAQIATVAELSASIAHEVNQPLAAVVANAHACLRWLSAEPPNLAKATESAERIVRDGKDAGEVVRRVRALFKRADVEKVPLDMNGVVREVLHVLDGEIARRRVIVDTDFADVPHVIGDRVQLQQLILNLVINALEAMDGVVDRPRTLTIRSKRRSGHTLLIEIRDDGIGLRDPDKAFEAFFTTKENGMGMGLAICRSIVEEHNGELWAASGEGPGTTLSFTLPLHARVAS